MYIICIAYLLNFGLEHKYKGKLLTADKRSCLIPVHVLQINALSLSTILLR